MKKFVFIHVPRTGGGSLNRIFKETCKDVFYQKNDTFIGSDIQLVDIEKAREFKIISGHIFYNRVKYLKRPKIIFLRNPIERVISQWCYLQKHDRLQRQFERRISFGEFIERTPNLIYKYSGGDLSKFDYIGFQETALKDYENISKKYDFSLSPNYKIYREHMIRRPPIDYKYRIKIRDFNKLDIELYNDYRHRVKK